MLLNLLVSQEGGTGVREGPRGQRREVGQVLRQGRAHDRLDRVLGAGRHHPATARQGCPVRAVQASRIQARDHVRAALGGAGNGLVAALACDEGVVASQQLRPALGQVEPSPGHRTGVDLVLQQAGAGVRLLHDRLGVAQHPGTQTGDGLDHDQAGDLSAVEDVVTDGQLADLDAGPAVVLGDARVDPLVAAAGEDDLVGPGQVLGHPLRTSSRASPHTSGFITRPAPPPSGVSSTVR